MMAKFVLLALVAIAFVARTDGAAGVVDCNNESNTDYVGHDVPGSQGSVGSVEKCRQICQANRKCRFFTYNTSSKACSLKSSDKGRKGQKGSVSGPKECTSWQTPPECKTLPDGRRKCVGHQPDLGIRI